MAERTKTGQFAPGESGNANGKPPGAKSRNPIPDTAETREEVKRFLADTDQKDIEKRTRRQVIYDELYRTVKNRKNANAQIKAAECLIERADGKPTQVIEQNVTVTATEDDLKVLMEYAGIKPSQSQSVM